MGGDPTSLRWHLQIIPNGQFKEPNRNLMLPPGFLLFSLLKTHHWFYLQSRAGKKDEELLFIKGLLCARLCVR